MLIMILSSVTEVLKFCLSVSKIFVKWTHKDIENTVNTACILYAVNTASNPERY